MSARWRCRTGRRVLDWDTVALLDGRLLDERMMGGRVLDWDVVALLDGRLLDERTLVKLDGRRSAGLEYGGVAGRETAGRANAGGPECWIKDTVALQDGRETAG